MGYPNYKVSIDCKTNSEDTQQRIRRRVSRKETQHTPSPTIQSIKQLQSIITKLDQIYAIPVNRIVHYLGIRYLILLVLSSRYLHEVLVLQYINKKSWCLGCTLKNMSCLFKCEAVNKYGELNIK